SDAVEPVGIAEALDVLESGSDADVFSDSSDTTPLVESSDCAVESLDASSKGELAFDSPHGTSGSSAESQPVTAKTPAMPKMNRCFMYVVLLFLERRLTAAMHDISSAEAVPLA